MCNACGFYCCASDQFERCGCEYCPDPACWPDDEDEFGDEDEYGDDDYCAGHAIDSPTRRIRSSFT
jgi:hypothetical protein